MDDKEKTPDVYEAITTYIIASICILIAVLGYFLKDMDTATVRWLIGFAVFLSSERDIGDFLRRG